MTKAKVPELIWRAIKWFDEKERMKMVMIKEFVRVVILVLRLVEIEN